MTDSTPEPSYAERTSGSRLDATAGRARKTSAENQVELMNSWWHPPHGQFCSWGITPWNAVLVLVSVVSSRGRCPDVVLHTITWWALRSKLLYHRSEDVRSVFKYINPYIDLDIVSTFSFRRCELWWFCWAVKWDGWRKDDFCDKAAFSTRLGTRYRLLTSRSLQSNQKSG